MINDTITESKLDHTIPDLKVNLPENDILWYDKNSGVAVVLVVK